MSESEHEHQAYLAIDPPLAFDDEKRNRDLEGKMSQEKKRLQDFKQTRPPQLTLWCLNDKQAGNQRSRVLPWDLLPKFVFGREENSGKSLTPITRTVKDVPGILSIRIIPGKISVEECSPSKKSGNFSENENDNWYERLPGEREELLLEVLKKLATQDERAIMLDGGLGVQFTLFDLQKELKEQGHDWKYSMIKEALICLSRTVLSYTVPSPDGKTCTYGNTILTDLGLSSDDNADGFARFHRLVSMSIIDGTYRQLNYNCIMRVGAYARCLLKRISFVFTQAGIDRKTGDRLRYSFKLKSFVENNGFKIHLKKGVPTISRNASMMEKALEQLISEKIIESYETEVIKEGKKAVDYLYHIIPTSNFEGQAFMSNLEVRQRERQLSLL